MTKNSAPKLIDKAVIDVGSNSVRLVIFRTHDTFFQPIFNEKITASLGRGVMQSGCLNPKGVKLANTAITRFMRILKARNITDIHAVATAAVRDAKDGEKFLQNIEIKTSLTVRMLSGEQEARLSALGVIAGEPSAEGVMADLGGSSLELVEIANGKVGQGSTHKLGPLALAIEAESNVKDTKAKITKSLEEMKITGLPQTLYAVGGAWRSLALVHMELRGYPLHVLHNYRMSRREVKMLTRLVEKQSPASLAKIPGVSTKRAQNLPYAAYLLRKILSKIKVREVVISSFGLREGLLFDALPLAISSRHPTLSSVEALAHQNWSSSEFGQAVEHWLMPVFSHFKPVFGKDRTYLLQTAICRLADIGARMHPDHRAEISFSLALYAPFAGLSHKERVALALAIYHRYAGAGTPPSTTLIMRIIDEDTRAWATAIGLGLRCASAVSARTASLLQVTSLRIDKGTIMLDAKNEESLLLTSAPGKRLRDLADALGLQAQLIE